MTRFPNEWSVIPRVRDSNESKRLWFLILAWFLFAGFWQLTLKSVMAFFFLLFGTLAEDIPVFSSDSLEKLILHSSSSRFVRCWFFAWNLSWNSPVRQWIFLCIKSFVFLQGIVPCIKYSDLINWPDILTGGALHCHRRGQGSSSRSGLYFGGLCFATAQAS